MKKTKQLMILFLIVTTGLFTSCKDDDDTDYGLSDLKLEFYLVNTDGEVSTEFKENENFAGIFSITNLTDRDLMLPSEWNGSWEMMTYSVYSDDDSSLIGNAIIGLIGCVGPWILNAHETKKKDMTAWYLYYVDNPLDEEYMERHFLPAGNYHAEMEVKNINYGIPPVKLTYSFKVVKP